MRAPSTFLLAPWLALGLVSCGSVELPRSTYYRLCLPAPPGGASPDGPTLAIGSVRLAAELASDRLVVRDGPVRLDVYRFHQWAGPLDRLLADGLESLLARSGRFRDVHAESVRSDLVLDVRVLAFDLGAEADGWHGHAVMEFRLTDGDGGLLLRAEFASDQRAAEPTPEGAVIALSQGLDALVNRFLACCEQRNLVGRDPQARPG